MAANIPRVAPSARQLLSGSLRGPPSRIALSLARQSPLRPHLLPSVATQLRNYATPPPDLQTLYNNYKPKSSEEWAALEADALKNLTTDAEKQEARRMLQAAKSIDAAAYVDLTAATDKRKPVFSDDEVIAASTELGVQLRTPEDLVAAQGVFKSVMAVASIEQENMLFEYYDVNGKFPGEVRKALKQRLEGAVAAGGAGAGGHDDHGHHDDHHAAPAHAEASSNESFGVSLFSILHIRVSELTTSIGWLVARTRRHSLQLHPLPHNALKSQ